MAVLTWDNPGDKVYETGISKGVFYGSDGVGVPWNGLTAVEEASPNTVEPVYYDGLKINDIVTLGDFSGTMRAWTYPDEFLPYEGILEDQDGFYVSNQYLERFGLCYRTEVGNDLQGLDAGYKIHLLYNLTAVPSNKVYATLSMDTEPHEFEWAITSIPEEVGHYRPTAHIIIDSRKINPHLLEDIESILYGDETRDAFLPSLKGLTAFIRKWDRFIVMNNGDGTWTAIAQDEGVITMLGDDIFEITIDTAIYTDSPTNEEYQISSTDKNEEDL